MNKERRNNLDTSPKKKLKYVILVILVVGATVSCACQRNQKEVTTVRADFRTNSIFYSLFVFADGKNFVIKWVPASSYDEALEYKYADTSNAFVLDSLNVFLNNVIKISKEPVQGRKALDSPRIEVYANNTKVYDAKTMDEKFWQLFSPIMMQVPKEFNPFLASSGLHP